MYKNDQIDILERHKDKFGNSIGEKVRKILKYYETYNSNYGGYSDNYKLIMERIFNTLNVTNYLHRTSDGILLSITFHSENIKKILSSLNDYLNKLNDLKCLKFLSNGNKNIVFIGPNGCGKTTFIRHLENVIGDNSLVTYFQAERLNIINSNFTSSTNPEKLNKERVKNIRYANDINSDLQSMYISKTFDTELVNFETQHAINQGKIELGQLTRQESKTHKILDLWNDLMRNRELSCIGKLKIRIKGNEHDNDGYSLRYMSSGEKALFFFFSYIILNPEKQYYFIDEPENSLNSAIVAEFWDKIENLFPHSIFVYLTHDCNFASSRLNSDIYYINEYKGNNDWDIDEKPLPTDDNLPKDLLVSMLGSGKPILFCESEDNDKYDVQLFKLMFPEFKVVPAQGCDNVKQKTKAYKKLKLPQKAYGIIDIDYNHEQYLKGQKKHNVFFLPFFEIENFLISKDILQKVIKNKYKNMKKIKPVIESIEGAIKKGFATKKELWIIRKIAFELRTKHFDKKIKQIKTIEDLKASYSAYVDKIKLDEMIKEQTMFFDNIKIKNDYDEILKYYDDKNNLFKTINKIVNKGLASDKPLDYSNEVFSFLKTNDGLKLLKKLRKKYFPKISK